MKSAFHCRKSIFYIIFTMISLMMFLAGGIFLYFVPRVSGVSAAAATSSTVEVVEGQKYIEYSLPSVQGEDKKSAFFYVSVGKDKTTGGTTTFEQTLVGNGETCFVEEGQEVVISFARQNKGDSEKDIAKIDEKELKTTATVTFLSLTIKKNGEEFDTKTGESQTGEHQFFYTTIQYGILEEGLYEFDLACNVEGEEQFNASFSIYLLKNDSYNNDDGTPKVSFSNGVHSVYLNSKTVAYERFFNYQNTGSSDDPFGLAALSFDPEHFKVSISREYEGKIVGYNFELTEDNGNSKLSYTKTDIDAPDLNPKPVVSTNAAGALTATITLKDLGTYNISYEYIYSFTYTSTNDKKESVTENREVSLKTSTPVRGDVLNIFGYQAYYSDYENDLTEFRSEKTLSFAADVTYKEYSIEEKSEEEKKLVLKDGSKKEIDLSKIDIVSTNQAPVRMKFNSSFVKQTYYKYEGGEWTEKTDQRIIFTDPGTYFVEYTYTFDGYKKQDTNGTVIDDSKTQHTQQFLFEITTTTPIIKTETDDGQTIYSDTFTNKDVVVTLVAGTEFDASVQVVISKSDFGTSAFSEVVTLKSGDQTLTDSGKYKIETKFGKNFKKTNVAYFTIDKEGISGLEAKTVIMADYTDVYAKSTTISGLFTNLQFALAWNKKSSGAAIVCDYQLIPLENTNSTAKAPIYDNAENGSIWIANGAQLKFSADDINNFVTYKNTYGKSTVSGSEILNEAGLYLFRLRDEAGNEAEFYIFLDNTQTKFLQQQKDSENKWKYMTPTALNNVSSDTRVVWGTHKAILLSGLSNADYKDTNNGRIANFFNKYGTGSDYFGTTTTDGKIYFTSKITKVWKYTDADGAQNCDGTYCDVTVLNNGVANEQVYNFYSIDSSNQKISVSDKFNQYDTSVYSGHHSIKVSTDMSKSMLLTSSEVSNIEELTQYGAGVVSGDTSLKNFYFTNKDAIYFALIKDIDTNIKVGTISCDYYALIYNTTTKTYEYSDSPTAITLTLNLWTEFNEQEGLTGDEEQGKYYICAVNLDDYGMTQQGKYVISRTYSYTDETESTIKDKLAHNYDYLTREFVFFVDRNPVLTGPTKTDSLGSTMKEVGEYIKLYVLAGDDDQILFDAFYRQPQVSNKNDLNSISEILKTNKLPVKLYIPFAKYGYDNDGTFTTSSVHANIVTGYDKDKNATTILHPNLNMRIKITFKSGNTIKTSEYDSTKLVNGYLDISNIAGDASVGEYFVDIYDGMGNSWMFKFVVSKDAPSMDFVAVTVNGEGDEQSTSSSSLNKNDKYTNADQLRVEWSDPLSDYLAKIDKTDITYTINGVKYSVKLDDIKEDGSKYYFVISGGEAGFEDGDVIKVFAHYEGKESDYPTGSYNFTREITIDYTAPTVNLNKMIDTVLIKNQKDLDDTRVVGKKYNKTIRTGERAYISYAITSDFRFEFSNYTSETQKVYYRRIDNKYTDGGIEINLPTDPSSTGANSFNANDFTWLRNAANFQKTTGLYEIVEMDSAGNYTVYTVYLYADPKEVLTVKYDGLNEDNLTQTFDEEGDAEISVFKTFTLKDIDINGDHWYDVYIKKDGETTDTVYRHTPFFGDGEVLDSNGNKTKLESIVFENDSKYIIKTTSRQNKTLKTLTLKIAQMSREFKVKFVEIDGGVQINIQKDEILEIKGRAIVEVGTLVDGAYVYENVEYDSTPLEDSTKLVVSYDTTKLLRLSIPTNFSTTQYFFYIYGEQQVENEVTGEDLITTDPDFDYVSSHDVKFTYNMKYYDVVVGAGLAEYSMDYTKTIDGNLATITLKAAAFTYSGSSSTVGQNRTFTLQINSLITSVDDEKRETRVVNININNLLPKINLYNDYGVEQNILFSGGITRQDVTLRFSSESIQYVVTIGKKGESDKKVITSGHRVSDYATYEVTCSLVGDRTASYTKYFTITKSELSVYAVVAKNSEQDEEYEFLQPSQHYYTTKTGETYVCYITNKPYVDIKTDSSLNITVSDPEKLASNNGLVVRLYTISNTNKSDPDQSDPNIYVNDKIVVIIVPQSNQILTTFERSGADENAITDKVSEKEVMTSTMPDAIESVRGNEQVKLTWNEFYLEKHNKILVTYKYEDQLVFEKKEISSIILSSSGKHTLIFEDMAGNKHLFTQNIQQSYSFDFNFIRSLVFKINDNNPIDYAVYNGEVKISIPDESLNFCDASFAPKITVKRAGEEIEVTGKNRVWTVSEPGFYEVSFLAKWGGQYILVEPVHFSIINPTEARLAYEFVGVEKYEIVSVIKGDEEIIDRFGGSGQKSFSATLADENTGEGRYTVTVRAKRDDENLPVLDFSFSFWLHQADPPIVVSVEQGTETKNVITVQFNVYNLYDEVGDCYVKIGNMDPIVLEGSSLSTMEELQNIEINDRGDYFIQVYTKSGNLVYSYRVIKKDPLNTVTIVLICVGSAVLVALTIVFVKLRKKVKIR